ncbi:LuxR C-terminal-related transcriptional regulator [Lutimonas zeaxanthinifaciens]|uniref:LuxR C-terminal-related transcriptional regulator n=1 Tax=Lutimonas zeaxanthinifaciens TaxID=3060215 RepID=UPI00265D027C|nr:LuxR C-terminal-related transcriptional regulator [Lutimonas sp. YSD2104]WKK66313.1 LuxR C-terminal-related transcriptional regulator [Lutimonas sp. YSD2104]
MLKREIENLNDFLEKFSGRYKDSLKPERDLEVLKTAGLSQTECMYILDFSLNKMIFKKGFMSFLGYSERSITLESYIKCIHPEDVDMVSKIGMATIIHTSSHPNENRDNVLYISFRIRKSNGEYVKVLSQSSVFEVDSEGHMVSSLVKVSDISFMEDNNLVKYNFVAQNLDEEAFKKAIYGENYDLFTSRELDIINEIEKGATTEEIAQILEISKHTVATHRKKILKKSGCHSAEELLHFCRKNGIL